MPRPSSKPAKHSKASDDPLRDASRGVRIQKALADAGVASRRACEELIEAGEVRVNGRVVDTLPAWVDPEHDDIVVSGRRLRAPERHVYVMLHKPRRFVTSLEDPDGRKTVADLVQHPSGARLHPVGRLDYETSGLILMTNDGELTNRLTHPRYGVEKIYRAVVKGALDAASCAQLEKGVYLAERKHGLTTGGARTQPVRFRFIKRDRDKSVMDITLKEGRNRQIRRMLAYLEHPVKKLVRTSIGPLELKGLAVGEWRELTRSELASLRKAVSASASARKARAKPTKAAKAPRRGEH